MADPFSIVAGSGSLLDVCWRIISYVRHVQAGAARVEEEVAALSHEIESMISVNQSLRVIFTTEQKASLGTSLADSVHVESLWRNVGQNLQGCQAIAEKLEGLLKGIIGKDGSKSPGKLDNLKKQLRRQSKDEEFHQLRHQLTIYQNSLQLSLTALNLSYIRTSYDSTGLSLGHLSEDVQLLGFKLQSEMAFLRTRLTLGDGRNLRDSITAAAAVASLVSLNKHFYIPQTVSSIFTGRKALLEELRNALDVSSIHGNSHVQNRFIIYGLGGSGKTQFCCKFAQDNRESFWGIFSIDASSFKSAQHSYSRIAKIGGVEPNERSAKHWLSSLEHPWLLLIDNADDYSISIDEYFPMGERGLILVTTRNPANKVHGTLGSGFYHFEELERDEADDLLLKAACEPRPWTCSAKESAAHISKALGFLPLALVHAGKAIMSRLCSLGNYLTFYEKNWDKIRRARKVSGYRGDENVNMNVYSSYEVIYQSLEARKTEESQDAIDLLKMFSFLYCENIRVDFLLTAATNPRLEREVEETEKSKEGVEGVSKRKPWMQSLRAVGFGVLEALFRDRGRPVLPTVLRDTEALAPFDDLRLRLALRELAQMSFITHQETADSYSMHPLVHKWVRERPQMSTGEQAIWCEVASTVLAQCILLPPLGSTEADEDLRRDLLPHVLCVQKYQEDVRIRLEENQKIRRRPWPALAPRFDRRQALRSAKFSLVYTQCGLWDEAEKLQLPVKDFACSMLGIEHPATIRIMLALSVTKFHQTRFNAAAELQDQVLQACMNSLGPDHPRTLKMMDTLGLSRSFQGRFREALELHETALEGMSKTLGASHEDTLLTLDHLGRTMLNHFRYDDAKDLHSRAVAGMKDVFGPTHLNTLTAMESLAMSYLELGGELLSPAHELMTEVLELRKKKLGREHPYTLLAICNLGRIKSALNRTDEAEEIMRAALPIAERTLGENHFGTLAGRAHLANVLVRQKRYSEAEDLFTDAIQQQRYVTIARDDGEHPDRIMAMYYLLKCYQLQGKTEDAIGICDELFESISKIGGQGLGLVHPFAKRLSNTRRELQASRDASAVEPLRVPEEMEVSLT